MPIFPSSKILPLYNYRCFVFVNKLNNNQHTTDLRIYAIIFNLRVDYLQQDLCQIWVYICATLHYVLIHVTVVLVDENNAATVANTVALEITRHAIAMTYHSIVAVLHHTSDGSPSLIPETVLHHSNDGPLSF